MPPNPYRRMIQAQMAKSMLRGGRKAVGGLAGFVSNQIAPRAKTFYERQRVQKALSQHELISFENEVTMRMSQREKIEEIRRLRKLILTSIPMKGNRRPRMNPIVLERLSYQIFPALAELKSKVRLNANQEGIVVSNIMKMVNFEMLNGRIGINARTIPLIDNIIAQAIEKVIKENLPQ
jgi:hypothetical protein